MSQPLPAATRAVARPPPSVATSQDPGDDASSPPSLPGLDFFEVLLHRNMMDHVCDSILGNLDPDSLFDCLSVSPVWRGFVQGRHTLAAAAAAVAPATPHTFAFARPARRVAPTLFFALPGSRGRARDADKMLLGLNRRELLGFRMPPRPEDATGTARVFFHCFDFVVYSLEDRSGQRFVRQQRMDGSTQPIHLKSTYPREAVADALALHVDLKVSPGSYVPLGLFLSQEFYVVDPATRLALPAEPLNQLPKERVPLCVARCRSQYRHQKLFFVFYATERVLLNVWKSTLKWRVQNLSPWVADAAGADRAFAGRDFVGVWNSRKVQVYDCRDGSVVLSLKPSFGDGFAGVAAGESTLVAVETVKGWGVRGTAAGRFWRFEPSWRDDLRSDDGSEVEEFLSELVPTADFSLALPCPRDISKWEFSLEADRFLVACEAAKGGAGRREVAALLSWDLDVCLMYDRPSMAPRRPAEHRPLVELRVPRRCPHSVELCGVVDAVWILSIAGQIYLLSFARALGMLEAAGDAAFDGADGGARIKFGDIFEDEQDKRSKMRSRCRQGPSHRRNVS